MTRSKGRKDIRVWGSRKKRSIRWNTDDPAPAKRCDERKTDKDED